MTSDQIWALPVADGDAGGYLTTDGAGVTEWLGAYIELRKTGSASQNHGGTAGTTVAVSWDAEQHKGTGFTHDNVTNNSRIQLETVLKPH